MSQKFFRKRPRPTNIHDSITRPTTVNSDSNSNSLLTHIATKMGAKRFDSWLSDARCEVDEANKQVVLQVRNDFAKKAIIKHFDREIREAIGEQMQDDFKIIYCVSEASMKMLAMNT